MKIIICLFIYLVLAIELVQWVTEQGGQFDSAALTVLKIET